MTGIHPDNVYKQGSFERGDARVGTVYGHRTAKEYNRIKVLGTEKDEKRKVRFLHFAQKLANDDYICAFIVLLIEGVEDPGMRVLSRIPNTVGSSLLANLKDSPWLSDQYGAVVLQEWTRVDGEGRITFYPPDSYKGGPITWLHRSDVGDESLVYESDKNFLFLNNGPKQDVQLTEAI